MVAVLAVLHVTWRHGAKEAHPRGALERGPPARAVASKSLARPRNASDSNLGARREVASVCGRGASAVRSGSCKRPRERRPGLRGRHHDRRHLKRGEIWTVAGGPAYTGKPRPAVIVQDDHFDATDSVTICVFTTDPTEAPLFRLRVEATEGNGLRESSSLMVDKITTVPRTRLSSQVGSLAEEEMLRFGRAALVFLGIATGRLHE